MSLDAKHELDRSWGAGDQSIDRANDDKFVCALMSTHHTMTKHPCLSSKSW